MQFCTLCLNASLKPLTSILLCEGCLLDALLLKAQDISIPEHEFTFGSDYRNPVLPDNLFPDCAKSNTIGTSSTVMSPEGDQGLTRGGNSSWGWIGKSEHEKENEKRLKRRIRRERHPDAFNVHCDPDGLIVHYRR